MNGLAGRWRMGISGRFHRMGAHDPVTEADLVREFLPLAYGIARDFYLPGGDQEDVRQEALVALLLAVRAYREGTTPLSAFIAIVIRRRLITAVRQASTEKNRTLNEAVRESVLDTGDVVPTLELVPALNCDPQELLERRDAIARLRERARALTATERRALGAMLDGIHQDKQIDNAVYRARRKLREAA